jgi:hypothetical protein
MVALSAFRVALALAAPAEPGALSPADQKAVLEVLCEDGDVEKGRDGWFCRLETTDDFGERFELHWISAWRGRFAAHPDEWVVSLRGTCPYRYCPGEVDVVRRVKGAWRRTHQIDVEAPLPRDCARFGGMPDGFDRLACIQGTGPHMGFLFHRLETVALVGGDITARTLMEKEQGGECFLDPPGGEYEEDLLTLDRTGGANADEAFAVRLEVRRAPCTPDGPEDHGPLVAKAERRLRFVRSGNEVVPDAASKAIIAAEGWAPEGAGEKRR